MNNCEKAIAILEKTRDGRGLHQTPEEMERHGRNGDGWQLYLIQCAVNNHLTASGQRVFDKLYECVMADDFAYSSREFTAKFFPEEQQNGP